VLVGFFFVALRNGSRIGQGEGYTAEWLTEGLAGGLVVGAAAGIVMYVGVRWQRRFGVRVAAYITFVLVAALVAVGVRALLGDVDTKVLRDFVSATAGVARLAVGMWVILAVAGVSARRLKDQVEETETALGIAREQALVLLKGDEYTRRQIATALHDRVQARLIAVCMEMQTADVKDPESTRTMIDSVVAGLEEVRSIDLRRAARALSPSLLELGLGACLEDLGQQYEPGMRTTVDVDEVFEVKATRPPASVLLGSYRIVEQALLNAAGHGAANTCKVLVHPDDDGGLRITVSDDGRGFASHGATSGFGSTLMTTWTQALGGTWSWRQGVNGGVTLEASIPRIT
jgi:two-component system, NarL family, sensor kinase